MSAAQLAPEQTSLDTNGFTVENWPEITTAQRYAHADVIDEKRLMDTVVLENEINAKRALRHRQCGSHIMLYMHPETPELKMKSTWCGCRTCPRCRKTYAAETATKMATWLGYVALNHWRFITLTLSHSNDPLVDQLAHLRASFRRLRQTELWRNSQQYGKGIIEVTYNEDNGMWHPHLHVLSRGSYIAQGDLSGVWKKATGGSYIVDVQVVKSGKHVANYVTKYMAKPPALPERKGKLRLLGEYYMAMRNKKWILSYGGAPPLPALKDCPNPNGEEVDWQPIGCIEKFITDARNGDTFAQEILRRLRVQNEAGRAIVANKDPTE